MDDAFGALRTLEDVRSFVDDANRRTAMAGEPAAFDPGQLMVHAVKLAGSDGLTRAQLEWLFVNLGQARFARGILALSSTRGIVQAREPRRNSADLVQWQIVFRYG